MLTSVSLNVFAPIQQEESMDHDIRVELQETTIRVMGVNFSELLIRGKEIKVKGIRVIRVRFNRVKMTDGKVGLNPREIGYSSS